MVWAILHPQDMSDDDRKKLKDKFVEHFENEQGLVTENGLLQCIWDHYVFDNDKEEISASSDLAFVPDMYASRTRTVPFHFCPFIQSVKVTSLHIQFFVRKEKGAPDPPIEHISGSPSIKERLLSLSFSVSPQAFFQVILSNT